MVTKKQTRPKAKTNKPIIVDFSEGFRDNFIEYGIHVITERALPKVEDGLKPVQRRSLYVFFINKAFSTAKTVKSGEIVGEVMGKYHPHGDTSIYEAIVNMAHSWNMFPLIKGKGNFGNIKGLSAAHSRYTEAKLSPYGDTFVSDLSNKIVPFVNNYSETRTEPTVLPAKLPFLLIAGTDGLAVGMSSNIPTHNPAEAINATIAYLKNPKITYDQLIKILPGPDFTGGGEIINKKDMADIYKNGFGKIVMRGRVEIEQNNIIVKEVPDTLMGRTDTLLNEIADLILKKKLPDAIKVEDFTNKNGIAITIKYKRGTNMKNAANILFAKTKLQDTIRYNFLALSNNVPKVMPLKTYLQEYVAFQQKILKNKLKDEIDKKSTRLDFVNALLVAFPNIEVIVDIVRHAKSQQDMVNALTKGKITNIDWDLKKHATIASKFSFTEYQADKILSTPLKRLSRLDVLALEKEKSELEKQISINYDILNSKIKFKNLLIKQHEYYLNKLDLPKRRTEIKNVEIEKISIESKINDMFLTVDKFGYLKQTLEKQPDDALNVYKNILKSNDQIGFFTSFGNFYKLKLEDIKQSNVKDKGDTLATLSGMDIKEHALIQNNGDVLSFEDINKNNPFIIQVSKFGLGKKVSSKDFVSSRKKTVGTKLKDNDELIYSKILEKETSYLIFVSNNNKIKKISINDVNQYGKASNGSQLSKPYENDSIKSVYQAKSNKDIIMINDQKYKVGDFRVSKPNHVMKDIY